MDDKTARRRGDRPSVVTVISDALCTVCNDGNADSMEVARDVVAALERNGYGFWDRDGQPINVDVRQP